MRKRGMLVLAAVALVVAVAASPVLAQPAQVIKPVPDVDKPGVPGGVPPTDLSCWMAAASNLLGGAGYGTGATAQARADNIYQTLVSDLGNTKAGQVGRAVNYWLYTYGKNPDSAEYQPNNTYTDVTMYNNLLGAADYDFLLDELTRCQYVAVNFDQPAPHAMTLVGGNKESLNPGMSQSIWHDSDNDQGGTNDDIYANVFGANPNRWDLTGYLMWANGYTTLCPGLNKPEEAVRNYDVAYYRQGPPMTPGLRVAGEKANDYAPPTWETDRGWALVVGNEEMPDPWHKDVYLLVDYTDRDNTYFIETPAGVEVATDKDIVLDLGTGEQLAPTATVSADKGQILYHWELDHQPAWERIVFPNADYYNLSGDVKDWNLATRCVPEPASLSLIVLGGLMLLRRKRR